MPYRGRTLSHQPTAPIQDSVGGGGRVYTHAGLASTGPWLFSVVVLGVMTLLFSHAFELQMLRDFRAVLLTNLCVSLVCCAPIFMVMTRYIAECIARKNVTSIPSVMLGGLGCGYACVLPLGIALYFFYMDIDLMMRIAALVNVFLFVSLWFLAVMLTMLRDYSSVTRSCVLGLILAVVAMGFFHDFWGDTGIICAVNLGLTYVVFSLISRVLATYNYRLHAPFVCVSWLRRYWELAVAGAAYYAALWVDKWMMWHVSHASPLPNRMSSYVDYESAMFLAALTMIPAFFAFVMQVERSFFARYKQFYDDIAGHMPLQKIEQNHRAFVDAIIAGARNVVLIQGTCCFLALMLAAKLYELLDFNLIQLGMFRLGVLGAFFHALVCFALIILVYVDARKAAMGVALCFLVTMILGTYWSMQQGFMFYGYGYFFACVCTFLYASLTLCSHVRSLVYDTVK